MTKDISLVIPLYNEEDNVYPVIKPLITALDKSGISHELILVNNGSLDSTPELISGLAKERNEIKIVNVLKNQGYGFGILKGLELAEGKFIGYLCGDGQTNPQDVIAVVKKAETGNYDLVKAHRVSRGDGPKRKIVSLICNLLMQAFFRIGTWDVNGTPKLFRKELLNKFGLKSYDWFIDTEIMLKAKILALKISEVPVKFFPRRKGKSNIHISAIFEFLKNIYRYKFDNPLESWINKAIKAQDK